MMVFLPSRMENREAAERQVWYEKNGQPMEKLLSYYVQSQFLRPKIRPYKTNNYYALLMKGGMAHDSVLEKDR